MTPTFDDSVPYLVMTAITVAHSTLTEALGRPTLGKAIMRARVVATDGSRPALARVLVRNAVKAMIILLPPLVIIAFVSPNLQGLDDLAGRTVVVASASDAEEDGADER
jgi:uncharacterized RDD family membrane protein YckC